MANDICIEKDCDNEVNITPGFQRLMDENPDIKPPKRCYDCRQKRKREKEAQGGY